MARARQSLLNVWLACSFGGSWQDRQQSSDQSKRGANEDDAVWDEQRLRVRQQALHLKVGFKLDIEFVFEQEVNEKEGQSVSRG